MKVPFVRLCPTQHSEFVSFTQKEKKIHEFPRATKNFVRFEVAIREGQTGDGT